MSAPDLTVGVGEIWSGMGEGIGDSSNSTLTATWTLIILDGSPVY